MKCIVWMQDGTISVNTPSIEVDIDAHARLVTPLGVDYFIIDKGNLPTNESFRDAWRLDAQGNVTIDLDAAKVIAHEQRRVDKSIALEPLDRQATYDLTGAEPLRQAIRDADATKQAAIDACTTIEELEGVCQA